MYAVATSFRLFPWYAHIWDVRLNSLRLRVSLSVRVMEVSTIEQVKTLPDLHPDR